MKYGYFPGCSLEKNAAAYDVSTKAIAGPLGLEFVEVEDWNCCGATEYMSLNLTAAYSLIARNLALASKTPGTDQLVAPCSLCYLNLRKCDKNLVAACRPRRDASTKALAEAGLSYKPGTRACPPPARRRSTTTSAGGPGGQGHPPADRPARGALLRLPGRPADSTTATTSGIPHEDGQDPDLAGGRGGRLPGSRPIAAAAT